MSKTQLHSDIAEASAPLTDCDGQENDASKDPTHHDHKSARRLLDRIQAEKSAVDPKPLRR